MKRIVFFALAVQILFLFPVSSSLGQIGRRFPSERKVVKDPVTGINLVFLTSTLAGDHKIYLIDRNTHQMMLLSAGHKTTAADHPHPTFSPDGTRIEIQSAMLSEDNRSMNICIIPVPENWLNRKRKD